MNRKELFFSSCWMTSVADFNYVALMSLPAKLIKSGFTFTGSKTEPV